MIMNTQNTGHINEEKRKIEKFFVKISQEMPQRSSMQITFGVWKALFLREAITRISKGRAAWLWLFVEPVFHVGYLMVVFAIIRMRKISGIDTAVWIMVGLLTFFMFKRTAVQSMNAINSNEALFAYRQVTPIDCVFVRAVLEGFLTILIVITALFIAALFGIDITPMNPLNVIAAFFGMWLAGLGFGLIASVVVELVSEAGKIIEMVLTPIYFISGVIFPIHVVPYPYKDWLLWNPLLHGLEAARQGFASYYMSVPAFRISIGYLYAVSLAAIFLGLLLHRRFAARLIMQ